MALFHIDLPFFPFGAARNHTRPPLRDIQPQATHPSSPSILQRHVRPSVTRHYRGYERSSVATRKHLTTRPLVWAFLNVVAIRPSAEIYPP